MRKSLLFGIGTTMFCTGAIAQENLQKDSSPNILFFIADDCTYRDLGCYGSLDSKTPNIDRFSNEGMKFTSCFQAVAMSSPTRSNLYTGLYPVKSGAYPNHTFVKEGTKSIVQYLAPKGYRTALLGKTHINPLTSFPFEYLGDEGDELDFNKMKNFLSERDQKKEPFCLFVASHQPHIPYTQGDPTMFDSEKIKLPPYFVDTKETREDFVRYLAEVNYMDEEFGRCLDLLKEYDFSENTLVVFTSEQGNSFPFAKWTCYGNGLQTGFLVKWPGKIKPGSTSNAMIEYVDVTPTLIDAVGLKAPKHLEGKSFLPVLSGEKSYHKKYVYGIQTTRGIKDGSDYYGIRTVRSESFRYILNLTPEETFLCNMITVKNVVFNSWIAKAATNSEAERIVSRYLHRPAEELYDVVNDPLEMKNIAADTQYADIKKELKEKLLKWMEQQGDKGQQTEMEALEHTVKGVKE